MDIKKIITVIRLVVLDSIRPLKIRSMFYVTLWKRNKIKPNIVLLECSKGKDFVGNPYYIARHILSSDKYSHLRVVIVCPRSKEQALRSLFGKRVSFCRVDSIRYLFYLAVAGFLVNDTTFPVYFSRREGQKYLNTWHGTPLKTLGRRCAKDKLTSVSNVQRNFLHATDIVAPNRHTEDVLLKDYMIENLWSGRVLHIGYPRNDILVTHSSIGSMADGNVINIAYMPTWRGTLATLIEESGSQIEELRLFFNNLEKILPGHVVIWVRLHSFVRGKIDLDRYRNLRSFPDDVEPYEHLALCDALVTDYSSVMFDFAITRKPIFLYAPDIDSYRSERDFCIDFDSLPFPLLKTTDELVGRLSALSASSCPPDQNYESFIETYCPHDHGSSTEALCAQYFLSQQTVDVSIRDANPDKKNIMIYGGSLLKNGITTSIKSLLALVDKERFNFTLLFDKNGGERNSADYFLIIDGEVGYIPIQKCIAVDCIDAVRLIFRELFSKNIRTHDKFLLDLWGRERRRIFGSSRVDVFVNFDGYARQAAFLMLDQWKRKLVYMHNDMAQELSNGRINDPKTLHLSYELADMIAVVRDSVETSYCKEYHDISQKTIFVPNTLSLECRTKSKHPLPEAIRDGVDSSDYDRISKSLNQEGNYRFINLGRFAPQKGQLRLIESFEIVWDKTPNVQLYILGGYGNLFEDVCQRAESSRARDSIFVAWGTENPFPLASRMDALVFSSYYEGIGLVLYEALALGLSVISTNIPGPSELLNEGYGLVVENSVNGLVSGMQSAMRGEVPNRTYDFDAHNKYALNQFYKALDA